VNGPDNISQPLRVPIADQPELGMLRLNTTEVRELGLNAGQTVRGIVAEDGRSVTLLFANLPRRMRGDFQELKGQSLDFTASRSSYGVTLKPSIERLPPSPASITPPPVQNPRAPVNLASLAALASNPALTDVPLLSGKSGSARFVDLVKRVLPDSAKALLPAFILSPEKIDAKKIRSMMVANGFIPSRIGGRNEAGDAQEVDIRRFLQQLRGKTATMSPNGLLGERAAIESVIDYMDTAKVEFMLRQEQRELSLRFMILFSSEGDQITAKSESDKTSGLGDDEGFTGEQTKESEGSRPPAEVIVERREQRREGKTRDVWSTEIKLSFSENDNVWGRVELLGPSLVSVTVWLSDFDQARLARQKIGTLRNNLEEFGFDVARCQVIHGEKPERQKVEALRSVGNLELRA